MPSHGILTYTDREIESREAQIYTKYRARINGTKFASIYIIYLHPNIFTYTLCVTLKVRSAVVYAGFNSVGARFA